jgi:serine protease Do
MNPSFRRLLALAAVFLTAFVAVSALRTYRGGGSFRDWIPGYLKKDDSFRPEVGTFPAKAPVNLADVELLSRLNDEYAKVTKAVVPSVVSINTTVIRTERLLDLWGRAQVRDYPAQGQGSGVIVTVEGHVVTNHHVIAGQKKIQVTLHDGRMLPARLIGEDTLLDIAVLKIDGDGPFAPLKIGDSSKVEVGQIVFAVGNPFGLGETVTQGIISAKERSLSDNQRDLFQTDAAINPGNSGGPLVNLRGEIIGINAAIISSDKDRPGFQGVGFSIPGNDVQDALEQILKRGRPIYSYIGVVMIDLDMNLRLHLKYDGAHGAVVGRVFPGSPAEAAGLRPKDIVLSCNGEIIKSSDQLIKLLKRMHVGTPVTLMVWRNGKNLTLNATTAESGLSLPEANTPKSSVIQGRTQDPDSVLRVLGIQVRDLGEFERMQGIHGVVVTGLAEDALAAELVHRGDLIVAVNSAPITSSREFFLHLANSAAVQDSTLTLIRDRKSLRVTLPAVPRLE